MTKAIEKFEDVVVWEWYHGGRGRVWKCYSGLEIELLESRKEDGFGFALLNGGQPLTALGLPSRPLRIEFASPWADALGMRYAPHTQHDLVTHKKRGVRRVRKTKKDKDYLYYRWITTFPRVSAMKVFTVYNAFLDDLNTDRMVATHLDEAWDRLRSLALENIDTIPPPQDAFPVEFCCQINKTIMLDPCFTTDRPRDRYERGALETWLAEHDHKHPESGEHVSSNSIVPDVYGWWILVCF